MREAVLTVNNNRDLMKLRTLVKKFKEGKSDGKAVIHAFKYTTAQGLSPHRHAPRIKYRVGYIARPFRDYVDKTNANCGAGINVASLAWVKRNQGWNSRIYLMEFTVADVASIPMEMDIYSEKSKPYGKFRLFKAKTVKRLK